MALSQVYSGRIVYVSDFMEGPHRLFSAAEGEELTVDATWFISEEWPDPMVVGWKGCLERIRFAFDPSDESFYFAAL